MSIDLNAGKVKHMLQQNQYHICCSITFAVASVLHVCLTLTVTCSYEADEID